MDTCQALFRLLATPLALASCVGLAQTLPPIPTTHPRVLLVGAELTKYQNALAASGNNAMKRFKTIVDGQVGGASYYGYEPWYSAFIGVVVGGAPGAAYCDHAIQMTRAFLTSEAAVITNGGRPLAAADSYLEIGALVGSVALVYDWCYGRLTAADKLNFGNYADVFTDNVWNQNTNHWGAGTAANNYNWSGTLRAPGSSWSVDNPFNNYYYSFLRATMLWGLVSKGEPGRTMADGFLQRFRFTKLQNQLVPAFIAQLAGGGSREGTCYGTSLRTLFGLYFLWEKTTGERIADLSPQAQETMAYMLHVTSPTAPGRTTYLAPIGDHSRDSTAAFYDYHRDGLEALATIYAGTPMARRVRDFLAASSVPQMGNSFNFVYDALYDGTETIAPAVLNTAFYGPGTGVFSDRSSWNSNATWLTFLTGPYTESHAHKDRHSFLLYKNGWLVTDHNTHSFSGIELDQYNHALVTQSTNGSSLATIDATMIPMGEGSATLTAMAVKPGYTYVSSSPGNLFPNTVQSDREMLFIHPDTLVVFDRAKYTAGTTTKRFLLPLEGPPAINAANRTATYTNSGGSSLKLFALAPTASVLAATNMVTAYPDSGSGHTSFYSGGYRLGSTIANVPANTLTQFLNVLSVDNAVNTATLGANAGAVTLVLADGRTVNVNFNLATQGGTIEVRNSSNQVVLSEALPTSIAIPGVLVNTDTVPDAFGFAAQTGMAINSAATSNTITPTGYNAAATISVSAGGSYSINGGTFVTTAGTLNPGQNVAVRQTTPASFNTMTTATLTVGGVSGAFNVTTGVITLLDVDGNGQVDARTDGLMLIRYMFDMRGPTLTGGAIGTGATRTAAEIETYIQSLSEMDVDGNGEVDALTDGLMLVRYMFGMRGVTLTGGAIGTGATRTAAEIEAYIQSMMP